MNAKRLAPAVTLPLLLLATFAAAKVETKRIPMVRMHSQILIAAPPSAVWPHLTEGKSLVTWCPMWKGGSNATMSLAKTGDMLNFTDEFGNGGRSVVTFMEKDKELRIAHEPNNGSYVCQAKITLAPSGAGTMVHYTEEYTDESSPKDAAATMKKMEGEVQSTLMALKQQVEKK